RPALRAQVGCRPSPRRRLGLKRQAARRPSRQTQRPTNRRRAVLVPAESHRLRLRHRPLDSATRSRANLQALRPLVQLPLPQRLVDRPLHHAPAAPTRAQRTRPTPPRLVAARRLAADLKKGADENAHGVLIDETGLFLNPLLRR